MQTQIRAGQPAHYVLQKPPTPFFVQGAEQRLIREKCLDCDVRLECLADALNSEMKFGVWGGLTERERRAMLRHYSHVNNWWEWINESEDPLAVEIREPRIPQVLAKVRA